MPVALVLVVFGQVGTFDFINWDDDVYVYDNPLVSKGLTGEGWAWAWIPENPPYFIPITWLSYMLDVEIAGLDPGFMHIVNMILHGINTALLFALFRFTTGANARSFLLAALFAIHPLHVEPVVWIAQRKELLGTCFALGSILAYVHGVMEGGKRSGAALFRGLALLLFALSLMSKPMWLTLPALLLLLDFWPLARQSAGLRSLLVEKLPFAAVSLVVVLISIPGVWQDSQFLQTVNVDPFSAGLATIPVSYVLFLWKTLFPYPLAVPYTYFSSSPAVWAVGGSIAILLVITYLSARARRSYPWLLFGWLWFLIAASTVLFSFGSGQMTPVADRWTYVPHIGLFVAAAWSVPWPKARNKRALVAMSVVAVLGILAGVARVQVMHWRDSSAWWEHVVSVTERNHKAYWLWGIHERREGNHHLGERLMRRAHRLNPREPFYIQGIGNYLLSVDREGEALQTYQALLGNPRTSPQALTKVGVLVLRRFGPTQAEAFLSTAAERVVNDDAYTPVIAFYLWATLHALGSGEEANIAFDQLVRGAGGSLEIACRRYGALLTALAKDDPYWAAFKEPFDKQCSLTSDGLRSQ